MTEQLALYSPFTFLVTSAITIWVFFFDNICVSKVLFATASEEMAFCSYSPVAKTPEKSIGIMSAFPHQRHVVICSFFYLGLPMQILKPATFSDTVHYPLLLIV